MPVKTKRPLNNYNIETTLEAPTSMYLTVTGQILWFSEMYLANFGPKQAQMLIVDGYDSHCPFKLIEFAI